MSAEKAGQVLIGRGPGHDAANGVERPESRSRGPYDYFGGACFRVLRRMDM